MKVSLSALKKTKAGGAMVGKRDGQTIIHDEGTMGGYLVGRLHKENGIKATVQSDGSPLEMQGGEVVITAPAVANTNKYKFEGKDMTPREILSAINVDGGGIAFAEDGMEIPQSVKYANKQYNLLGNKMAASDILEKYAFLDYMASGGLARCSALTRAMKMLEQIELPENFSKLKENPEKGVKFIADQALGRYETGEITNTPGAYESTELVFGTRLTELAIKAFPLETPPHIKKEKGGMVHYHKNKAHERALVIIAAEPPSETTYLYKDYKRGGFVPKMAFGGPVSGKPLKLADIPAIVKRFMPEMQQKAIVGSREHEEVLEQLKKIIEGMPHTYQTEKIPTKDKIVYLHYFYGESDWYIVEKDKLPDQQQAFGYTILNGDLEYAEWGYISIEELKQTRKVELDFYFDPIKFGELFPDESEQEEEEPLPAAQKEGQTGLFFYGQKWGVPKDFSIQLILNLIAIGFKIIKEKEKAIYIEKNGYTIVVNDNGGEFNLEDPANEKFIDAINYIADDQPVNDIKLAYRIDHEFYKYIDEIPDYVFVGGRFNSLDLVKFDDATIGDEWLKKTGLGKKDMRDPNGYEITKIEGDYASDYIPEGFYAWKGKPGSYLTKGIFESALSHMAPETKPIEEPKKEEPVNLSNPVLPSQAWAPVKIHFKGNDITVVAFNNIEKGQEVLNKIGLGSDKPGEGYKARQVKPNALNIPVSIYGVDSNFDFLTMEKFDQAYNAWYERISTRSKENKTPEVSIVSETVIPPVQSKEEVKKYATSPYSLNDGKRYKKIVISLYPLGLKDIFDISEVNFSGYDLFIKFDDKNEGVIDLTRQLEAHTYTPDARNRLIDIGNFLKFIFDMPYEQALEALETRLADKKSHLEPTAPAPVIMDPAIPVATNKREQANLNATIMDIIKAKGTDINLYSADDKALLKLYEGAGGLAGQGATGKGLFWQFFTPLEICEKMWGLAFKYGFTFNNTNILEPAYGSARFLQYIPQDAKVYVRGYEIEETAYTIGKVLFPKYDLRFKSFETMFFTGTRHIGLAGVDVFYDLVIGNPPYYDYVSEYARLGEKQDTGATTFEMYFIMRGVDVLKKGGLLVFLIPASFMSNNKKYNDFKEQLSAKAELLDAYRLPSGVFPNTEVTTDIIVLRKK